MALTSPLPDLYGVLMPAQPAVLDAAGTQIHPARAAIARYTFTATGDLTAESRREYATHSRDLEKRIKNFRDQRSQAMKRVIACVNSSILTSMTNYDLVRYQNCVSTNFTYAFPLFGAHKIVHTLMPPGQHAQRLGRHELELINKETAV